MGDHMHLLLYLRPLQASLCFHSSTPVIGLKDTPTDHPSPSCYKMGLALAHHASLPMPWRARPSLCSSLLFSSPPLLCSSREETSTASLNPTSLKTSSGSVASSALPGFPWVLSLGSEVLPSVPSPPLEASRGCPAEGS